MRQTDEDEQLTTFGIKTSQPGATFEELAELWTVAEQAGFTSAWLHDHLTALPDQTLPSLEAWTLLSALAVRTERIRIGVLVTDNSLRHPGMLAREAVTVDQISQGRLDFAIGAGNPQSEIDYHGYGITTSSTGERISKLEESVQIFKALWTRESVTFAGRFYQLDDARPAIRPVQQPHPPIWIGGSGNRVLRITARHADAWNFTGPIERFAERATYLQEYMLRIGRDPEGFPISAQFPVEGKSIDQIRAEVERYVEAGATTLMAIYRAPYAISGLETAARAFFG
jgi:alkanesulfonate monooxygenase SsuD/methylene tetrahydromethanopterin reductase-like flavin-dependent oxidoreductase (luciferase family)